MIGSLYSGLSGIQNHQKKLEVIGNNISNVNTMGFKSGRVLFSDAISQNLEDARAGDANKGGVNPQQIGAGVQIKTVDNNFSQGALKETGVRTDLAFDGRGFFILSDGSTQHYTRSGAFDIDEQGFLVDSGAGMIVQGKIANDEGVIETGTSIEDIQLKFGDKIPAKATTEVEFASNLDARGSENVLIGDTAFTTNLTESDTVFTTNKGAPVSASTEINKLDQVTAALDFTDEDGNISGDTITISGTDANGESIEDATFTYGVDGTTLGDLANKIETAFFEDSSADEVKVGNNGHLRITPPIDELTLAFNDNPDNNEGNKASDITLPSFSRSTVPADKDTAINSLRQVSTDLNAGDTIAIAGTDSDGDAVDVTFTYGNEEGQDGTTLENLLDKIDGAFANSTPSIDSNGSLILTPPDNTNDEISLSLAFTDVDEDGSTISLPEFNFEGYQYDTSFVAYDSEGYEHTITVIFEKTNENEWNWEADVSTPGASVKAGTNSGTITFNSNGSLKNFNYIGGQSATALQFDPGNGAGLVSIDLDTGTEGGFDGITQFASESNVAVRSQDGYSMGMLQDFDIDEQGMITGIFTNGLSRTQAQLAIADFNNPSGLVKEGNNYYQPSANSGQAVLGEAGTAGLGSIRSGTLELSNVDLANQFTKLVIAQRGFQANSNVITTTDTLFADLMRLKRA